jgi:hypothetical protein
MLIKCPECNGDVSSAAVSCPKCGHPLIPSSQLSAPALNSPAVSVVQKPKGRKISPVGCGLIFLVGLLIIGFFASMNGHPPPGGTSGDTSKPDTASTDTSPAQTSPKLALISTKCRKEYGFEISEGEVMNMSSEPLRNVEAVTSYYDKSGSFVTSSDALISYNPVLPGQTSPFKTMTTDNPAIARCEVTFKDLLGGRIETGDPGKIP